MMDRQLNEKRECLLARLTSMQRCVVAYSGGVDSAVVAYAAHMALADNAWAVTAVSPSLAAGELEAARTLAAQIGIRHEIIQTQELQNPDYVRNLADRCFHCKTELYQTLNDALRDRFPGSIIVNGANRDDLSDHRPGLRAARDHHVRSPLAECGFSKEDVRALAHDWQLAVWDKPASPCLSSRIAYGLPVTTERLNTIDQAESVLRELGFGPLRVRLHADDLARIEVGLVDFPRLLDPAVRQAICARLRELGLRFLTLDLEGFRSGSLNTLVPLEQLERGTVREPLRAD